MPRKVVSKRDLRTLFNYAIAHSGDLANGCRSCRAMEIERRPPARGRSNWTYRVTCKDRGTCRSVLDKIAREIGAVYDVE
jgi:hypothetical protein